MEQIAALGRQARLLTFDVADRAAAAAALEADVEKHGAYYGVVCNAGIAKDTAFPAMTAGLVSTAALWLGLALFVIAVAYPMGDFARAALTLIGSSMMAAVIAFAMSARPEYA